MFPVLPSSRPYRDVDIGDVSRSTELSSLSGRGTLATFPVLPSFRPYRDVDIGDVSRSTELWPLTGLFVTVAVPCV